MDEEITDETMELLKHASELLNEVNEKQKNGFGYQFMSDKSKEALSVFDDRVQKHAELLDNVDIERKLDKLDELDE